MLKIEHIKIRVTKVEREFINEYASNTQTTISNVLRALINQLKEMQQNEFKQA